MSKLFTRFAGWSVWAFGHPLAFVLACLATLAWAVTGPLFNYSDTWQLESRNCGRDHGRRGLGAEAGQTVSLLRRCLIVARCQLLWGPIAQIVTSSAKKHAEACSAS
jgi:hypothetical protein